MHSIAMWTSGSNVALFRILAYGHRTGIPSHAASIPSSSWRRYPEFDILLTGLLVLVS